jgi:uncharacterized protein (DUF1501 family)
MRSISRRIFFRQGSLALVAIGLPPDFLTRSLLAETRAAARKKTLICIFQRGAVDGLAMVVPFGEKAYYERRRSIAVAQPGRNAGAIDLDGFFGLHPSLSPLHDLWRRREMAIVHAVGSPHPTRSHFDAQDWMETAAPGNSAVRDGWLNRVLQHTACDCDGRTLDNAEAHAADHAAGQAALALSPALRGIPHLPQATSRDSALPAGATHLSSPRSSACTAAAPTLSAPLRARRSRRCAFCARRIRRSTGPRPA